MPISTSGTRTSSVQRVPFTILFDAGKTSINDTEDTISLDVLVQVDVPAFTTGTVCSLAASSPNISGTTDTFKDVRVGDKVTAIGSSGSVTLPTPATFTIALATFNGLDFLVYTGTPTLPKAGDSISGTGIGASAKVVKVDTVTKRIYVDVVSTESTLDGAPITATVSPLLRVITKTSNQAIVLNANFTGTGSAASASVTFNPEPFYASLYTIELDHIRNSSNDSINVQAKAYVQSGLLAYDASGIGGDGLAYTSGVASNMGSVSFNSDTFFTNARVARSNS